MTAQEMTVALVKLQKQLSMLRLRNVERKLNEMAFYTERSRMRELCAIHQAILDKIGAQCYSHDTVSEQLDHLEGVVR